MVCGLQGMKLTKRRRAVAMVKVVVREMRRRKVGWLAPVLSCVADHCRTQVYRWTGSQGS
jgi:hypothetical protein